MDCRRAEELFSDHLDRGLDPILTAELERHLDECAACRALRDAFAETVVVLRAFPSLEPTAGLAERVATAALRNRRSTLRPTAVVRLPGWLQLAAAVLAVATTAGVLYATHWPGPGRTASRLVNRTMTAGAYLVERKERLVEDVRFLRVVITTAFEGRLDRMNDRVDDYRRLLERRRAAEQQKKNRGSAAYGGAVLIAERAAFRTAGATDS